MAHLRIKSPTGRGRLELAKLGVLSKCFGLVVIEVKGAAPPGHLRLSPPDRHGIRPAGRGSKAS
jgi:hypothetical protein